MFTPDELKNIDLFSCLDEKDLGWLCQIAGDNRVTENEWIIREGDPALFFILFEGQVDVLKNREGSEHVVDSYGPGSFFGETSITLSCTALASMISKTPCRVLQLDCGQFKELLKRSGPCKESIEVAVRDRVTKISKFMEQGAKRVIMVGSETNECRSLRSFLTANGVAFDYVDAEADPERMKRITEGADDRTIIIQNSQCRLGNTGIRQVAESLDLQATQAQETPYDVAIVGAGPAGLAAAVYAASEGLSTLLIERNTVGGQAGTSSRIENYLGFPGGISGEELSSRSFRQAKKFGAEIMQGHEVNSMDLGNGTFCLNLDSGTVCAKSVILAAGVTWRRLQAIGLEQYLGRCVFYGAGKTETTQALGKDVVIVGGGNSAGQAAMHFSKFAKSVTIMIRKPDLSSSMSQYLIDQLIMRHNVKIMGRSIIEIFQGDSQLRSLHVSHSDGSHSTLNADLVFVMIGADTSTDWLPERLERDDDGYVCTGPDLEQWSGWKHKRNPFLLETNIPGMFCVGDIRHGSVKRVASAAGEGSIAISFVHQYLSLKGE